jgi:hypothetical protein
MKIRDLFVKDPLTWSIANEGVSSNNSEDQTTLKYELATFVCEGEYESGLSRIIAGYLSNLGKEQHSVWVSGFYGSGKSHLVKVLRYLWTDLEFDGGETARNISTLPNTVTDLLRELSTRTTQNTELHSAGGTLSAGSGDVRRRLLGIIFKSVGLPENLSRARLIMDLKDDGILDAVRDEINAVGKSPEEEITKLYTSPTFHAAYLKHSPHMNDAATVAKALREQYPTGAGEISIEDMLANIRRALSRDGQLPNTVIVLDELQQFIGEKLDIAMEVQDVVEACSKQLDGKVMIVGTGQSALTDTPALQKLMGRFTIKSHLRDNDVEKVVRKVVLEKKPEQSNAIENIFTDHSGEVSRQLKSTKIATVNEDKDVYNADYPLLPVRRRFWRSVLNSTDHSGTAAQMRTQLRVTHEAVKSVADRELGAVIPGDFLYDQLASNLVISGEMQKRFQEIIEEQVEKQDGELRRRVCATVFMINKLPAGSTNLGIRANSEHISDLLASDLEGSAADMRSKLPDLLEILQKEGTLMEVDSEYRLQTTEGAKWEQEYQSQYSALVNDQGFLAGERGRLLDGVVSKKLGNISTRQGHAKVTRKLSTHYGLSVPPISDGPIAWVRDGFQETESDVVASIQSLSSDDATIHVFIPRSHVDDLRSSMASEAAADKTLSFMGSQSTDDGREAATAMRSRQSVASSNVSNVIDEITKQARTFLSGGQDLTGTNLEEDVKSALDGVLGRLFPNFHIADSSSWNLVWSRAKQGNAAALEAIGHQGDPEKHAVAAQIISSIGSGKKGRELVDKFTALPYGWPKDSVDATLATLLVSGHLSARLNGQPTTLGELNQAKIGQADFRLQQPVLTAAQKLKIRSLFKAAGHPSTPGEEEQAAYSFLDRVRVLVACTGGEPPVPLAMSVPELKDLEGKSGNDLLFDLFSMVDDLTPKIEQWKKTALLISERLLEYTTATEMLTAASGVSSADDLRSSLEAIKQNRSLLEDPNPVSSVKNAVSSALRDSLNEAHARFTETFSNLLQKLNDDTSWIATPEDQRIDYLNRAGVMEHAIPGLASDAELMDAVRSRNLEGWKSETDSLKTRISQALSLAIVALEPKAKHVTLPSSTIHDSSELESWLTDVKQRIEAALNDGPVILE